MHHSLLFLSLKSSFKLLFVGVKCQNVLLPKNNFLNFDSFFAEKLLLRRCWWFFFCLQMSFRARQVLHHSPKTSIAWDRWDNCATEIELQTSPITYACFIDEWLHVHLRAVVAAQLVERSLLIPEICSLNPNTIKILSTNCTVK